MTRIFLDYYTRQVIIYLRYPRHPRLKNGKEAFWHTPKAKEDNHSIFRRFKQKKKRAEVSSSVLLFFCQ